MPLTMMQAVGRRLYVGSGGGGGAVSSGLMLYTDMQYISTGVTQAERAVQLFMTAYTPGTPVRINGKAQTVSSVADESGIGGSSLGIRLHKGLKKDGLISATGGYVQRITIICDNVVAGDTGLTVDGATSYTGASSLPLTVGSTGKAYFANSATGSDANNGLTPATAWATLKPAFNDGSSTQLARGDVLYCQGTFNQSCTAGYSPGSHAAVMDFSNVASAARTGSTIPVSVVNYRGTRPVLSGAMRWITLPSNGGLNYVNISGFEATATVSGDDPASLNLCSHLRISAMVCHGQSYPYGAISSAYSSDVEFWGLEIYGQNAGDTTNNQNHAIYFEGNFGGSPANQDNCIIGFCHVHNNGGGRGIQVYGHDAADSWTGGLTIGNEVHDVRCDGILTGGNDASNGVTVTGDDWIHSYTLRANYSYSNNKPGDTDFSDFRFGFGAAPGHGPTFTAINNISESGGAYKSFNFNRALAGTYTGNYYQNAPTIDASNPNMTNGGGNVTGTYT